MSGPSPKHASGREPTPEPHPEPQSQPRISYPPELPVSERRDDIAKAIRDHQVVIVAGETGSGKTTQLPKICLELGRGRRTTRRTRDKRKLSSGGLIGHTQPRRIAARSVAERIAEELSGDGIGSGLGDVVGYQVRFTDKTSRMSRVKVMTDGILLAELQRDRLLRRYDTIIVDEAHERSLNIDFLLGYLKRLLPRRPDLKVIITSATIDSERFAEHFADRRGRPAPIIEVSGRTYPVEVRYRPLVSTGSTGDGDDVDEEGEPVVRDQTEAVVDAVRELAGEGGAGDVLVFLPGEREIRDTADVLADVKVPGRALEVVPLYSRLSAAEQHRVFSSHPDSVRRVVLATNVAETSLTVPGIRYVVDTGVARISRYSSRTKVQRLPIEPISQASANQRAGRCGRLGAGIAIRLYSEEDFEARPEYTDPEILRTNLASVILQMTALGLSDSDSGDIAGFPFLDPPDRRNISAGVQLLEELGALATGRGLDTPLVPRGGSTTEDRSTIENATTEDRSTIEKATTEDRSTNEKATTEQGHRLTKLGRRLARLPIDPRLGRMILEAERLGCVREVVVIAAALSLQDPRERPAERQAQADQLHARFKDQTSDFLTWLNLWRHLKREQRSQSGSAFRRMCRRELLNYLRVREWQDFESQLRQVCREMGVEMGEGRGFETLARPSRAPQPPEEDADAIHQALLSGLLSHIGALDEREKKGDSKAGGRGGKGRPRGPREYLGARGTRFAIFPGSALKGKNPAFVMAGELVETGRLWARQNAAIDPAWAERLGGHLVKRTYSEPHWSTKRAAVMAQEKVQLYGVTLVAGRLVNYAAIDPELSRELFIRHALVQGEWPALHSGRYRFYDENRELLEAAEELEHRARRRDIVVDEDTLFDFYDARVGAEVVSGAHFDGWWKKVEREARQRKAGGDGRGLLDFDPSMLTHDSVEEIREHDFPTTWQSDEGLAFTIGYHFDPGADDDGLTIEVPVTTLNRVDGTDFSWLVPGLREELVTQLIRSLPKPLRVGFVPAPNTARAFLEAVPAGAEPLLDALERYLRATTGVHVPRDAWGLDRLPAHLRPTFAVVDEKGAVTARGKDLDAIKEPLRPAYADAIAEVAGDAGHTSTGQTTWTFGTVPEVDTWRRAGHEVRGYPALVDEGRTVGQRVFASADEAEARHRLGLVRLLDLATPEVDGERSLDSLDNAGRLALAATPYPTVAALLADLRRASLFDVVDALGAGTVRNEAAYDALRGRVDLAASAPADLQLLLKVLAEWRETDKALSGRAELATLSALTEMRGQLGRLVYDGFLGDAGIARLRHYPRYLQAIRLRRARLEGSPPRSTGGGGGSTGSGGGSAGGAVDRDRRLTARIGDLQSAYLHQLSALPDGRPPGAALRAARWLLEEYRVSLWAQQLGTAEKVSDQRIRKVLDATTHPTR